MSGEQSNSDAIFSTNLVCWGYTCQMADGDKRWLANEEKCLPKFDWGSVFDTDFFDCATNFSFDFVK